MIQTSPGDGNRARRSGSLAQTADPDTEGLTRLALTETDSPVLAQGRSVREGGGARGPSWWVCAAARARAFGSSSPLAVPTCSHTAGGARDAHAHPAVILRAAG